MSLTPQPTPSLEHLWNFPPDVPTRDLLEFYDLFDRGQLQWVVEDLLNILERGEFQLWEAVVLQENGLPLSPAQQKMLKGLLDFSDDPDEKRILYLDDMPRPAEPWYASVRKVVPHLLIEPFYTSDAHYEVTTAGWPKLVKALVKHGKKLSLPEGVTTPVDVVPPEVRHRLWLQSTFEALSGLGQDDEQTLHNEEQIGRIEEFVTALRCCRESVAHLSLSLDGLMEKVVLPKRELPLFVGMMQEQLRLTSTAEPLAPHLTEE